jgi:membrane-bound lytic murein transglycosylase D
LGAALLLALAGCAPRQIATLDPPVPAPIPEAPSGPADPLLVESRTRAESGESLLSEGDIERAEASFREAIELLESYLAASPGAGPAPGVELDRLRVRLDSLAALDYEGRNGIDNEPDVMLGHAADEGLPMDLNPAILARLEYYTNGAGRSTIEVGLEQMGLYGEMIRAVFREEGVPESLIHLAQAESTFKPEAVSRSAARGMWQFMAARGSEYGLRQNRWVDERSDPEKSTRAAARHLRDLFDRFGDWRLAMAAYNGGPAHVDGAMRRSGSNDFWTLAEGGLLNTETRNYVPTILAMAIIGADPAAFGFDIQPREAGNVVRVAVDRATDLRVISERLGVPLEELQALNPHVLREATPPDDPEFELRLPDGYAELFETRVAPLGDAERILFRYHVVSGGETLSHISRLYEVPASAIADANRLANLNAIGIGQELVIPLSGVPLPQPAAGELPSRPPPPGVYEIRAGDTLSGIAERFGLRVEEIREQNGLTSSLLIAGKTLSLAPRAVQGAVETSLGDAAPGNAIVYNVRPGDTLSRIAVAYRTSVSALREWNLGADLSVIYPGDQIRIQPPAPQAR